MIRRILTLALAVAAALSLAACTPAREPQPVPADSASPVPRAAGTEEAEGELLAALAGLFDNTEVGTIVFRCWFEPGSGPSPWEGGDRETLLPELEALFSACSWTADGEEAAGEPEAPELPEGAAGAIQLMGELENTVWMRYNSPYVRIDSGEGSRYYHTAEFRTLYRGLEELWYRHMGPEIISGLQEGLDELAQAGRVTARLTRLGREVEVSALQMEQIKALIGSRDWMLLPGGPQSGGARGEAGLVISGGDGPEFSFYEGTGYVWYQFCRRSFSRGGGEDCLFPELCALLGLDDVEPEPCMTPEAAKEAVLAGLDEIFAASEDGPAMCYHADPGSGSSRWGNLDSGARSRLRELFAACDWMDAGAEYTGEIEGKERAAMLLYDKGDAPEGAAFLLTLHSMGAGAEFSMYRGQPYVKMYDRYYETGDYARLYEDLERLWYEYMGDGIDAYVQNLLEEHFAGRTVTVRVVRGGEVLARTEWAWSEAGPQIVALLAESRWISVPAWYNRPPEDAGRLILSDGQGGEVVFHECRPFLTAYGFHYKSVDEAGEEKPLFGGMCGILGLDGQEPQG